MVSLIDEFSLLDRFSIIGTHNALNEPIFRSVLIFIAVRVPVVTGSGWALLRGSRWGGRVIRIIDVAGSAYPFVADITVHTNPLRIAHLIVRNRSEKVTVLIVLVHLSKL